MEGRPSRKTFQLRLAELVETIRNEILTGVWREGDFLPSEKEYAKRYRLSNKSVRQGMEILLKEGLIVKIPRVGTKVLKRPAGAVRAGPVKTRKTLRFVCHPSLLQEAAMETLLGEFRKEHPDIRVELMPAAGNSLFNWYTTVKKSFDEGADAVTLNYNGFANFMEHGGLDELESMIPDPLAYSFLNETFSFNGELKVRPIVFSPLVLCYNKSHFREFRVPEPESGWRWTDLFEQTEKLAVEQDRIGFYFHFPSTNRWPVFLLQSGIRFDKDERGRLVYNRSKLREALRVCRNIYTQGRFPLFLSETDADAEELFFNGKVSVIMTTYFSLNHYERSAPFEYDVAPLPVLREAKTLLMAIGVAVNAHSPLKDQAMQLANFLGSPRAQLIIRQNTLSIPALVSAAEWSGEEIMYRPSRFLAYRDQIPHFRTFSALNLTIQELDLFFREAKLYWSGLETENAVTARLENLLFSDP